MALMGMLMAQAGDWEGGCALVERASTLNPNHPGWYHLAAFGAAYRKQDYRAALEMVVKLNMPRNPVSLAIRASTLGQLGEHDAARAALAELLALQPDFASTARDEFGKPLGPEIAEHLIDGLRKAGLNIAS